MVKVKIGNSLRRALINPYPTINKESYAKRLERWIKSIKNSEENEYRN